MEGVKGWLPGQNKKTGERVGESSKWWITKKERKKRGK